MGTVSLRNPYSGFTTHGKAAKLVRKATCMQERNISVTTVQRDAQACFGPMERLQNWSGRATCMRERTILVTTVQ